MGNFEIPGASRGRSGPESDPSVRATTAFGGTVHVNHLLHQVQPPLLVLARCGLSAMTVREDMVKRAVGFLRHPKVKGASQEKQVSFLRDKKLSTEEIDEALRRTAELRAAETSAKARAALVSAPTRRFRKGSFRSEAVVSCGMVYVSEQTAWTPWRTTSGGESGEAGAEEKSLAESVGAEEQTARALANVKRLLEDVGSSPSKVVSALLCVRDVEQDLGGVNQAWGRWIDRDNPPARTVVQTGAVAGSGGSGIRISISVTAHL